MNIFPNPTSDYILVIGIEGMIQLSMGKRKVMNQKNVSPVNNQIDIRKIVPGIYYLNYLKNQIELPKKVVVI